MKPLEGIKVIDFTQAHAGSLGTMLLADFGAEVIKVERPRVGDMARYWPPFKGNDSGYYAFLNRNKKSITVDTRSEEGQELIKRLIESADVVCENFKVGNMEKFNLGYENLKKINPKIIYASVSGYGITGPMKKYPAYDLMLQAMSGIMDMTGFEIGMPTKIGPAIGDHVSGTYMANAVCIALLEREKSGLGQRIDIGILDTLCSILDETFRMDSEKLSDFRRIGNRDFKSTIADTFKTRDGFVTINISSSNEIKKLCEVMSLEIASIDKNKVEERLALAFKKLSKFDIEDKLTNSGIACSAVRNIEEIMEDKTGIYDGLFIEVEDKRIGKMIVPANPISLSKSNWNVKKVAPELGEDTVEVLRDHGFSRDEINELYDSKIV
ncbi:MAG: CoA transferase [Firmicutes bacterium]|jgi:CoA:oxalate CoA-transferase|nr:CoA transferase [Bacillota bacterium]